MAVFLVPDKIYVCNGVTVKDYFLTVHNPGKIPLPDKRTKKLLGVTIHNTEEITPARGTTMSEQYARATMNGNMRDVRVHYYVDDKEAWHTLPDEWCGWHAADGFGNGNTATIAIEIIGNTAEAEENGARLAAFLLDKYGFGVDCLYTHSYWLNVMMGKTGGKDYLCTLINSRKNCPAYIIPHWGTFVNAAAGFMPQKSPRYCVQVGAFSSEDNAKKLLAEVRKKYPDAFIKTE